MRLPSPSGRGAGGEGFLPSRLALTPTLSQRERELLEFDSKMSSSSPMRFLSRHEWGLLLAIVVVGVVTALLDDQHNYWRNPSASAIDIVRQTSMLGIFALGAAIVIIAGGIDLSNGSVIAFSGTMCAVFMTLLAPDEMQLKVQWYKHHPEAWNKSENKGIPVSVLSKLQPVSGKTFTTEDEFREALKQYLTADELGSFKARLTSEARFNKPLGFKVLALSIGGTLVIGFLIGSLHAWLITVVGLPPFVATLATLVGLRSFGRAIVENATLAAWKAKSTQIQIYDDKFRYLATSVWIPAVLFVVLIGLLWLMLSRTVVGRHVYALGGNEQAARLSGIRTDRLKWLAYVISAMLSSLAGMLYIGDQSVADPQTLGRGYELNAIAAAVVGGCSLQGGAGTIPGTVLGALFLRTVVDGVAKIIKSGADVYEGLIVGVVVVFAVAFTQLRQAGRSGKRFFAGPLGIVAAVNLALFAGAGAALFGQKSKLGPSQIGALTALVALGLLLGVRWLEGRSNR